LLVVDWDQKTRDKKLKRLKYEHNIIKIAILADIPGNEDGMLL